MWPPVFATRYVSFATNFYIAATNKKKLVSNSVRD